MAWTRPGVRSSSDDVEIGKFGGSERGRSRHRRGMQDADDCDWTGLLALLTVVVVMRYAMASGLATAPEITELMFAIFVMAGIVQAARMGVHVATQLLLHLLQGKWRTRAGGADQCRHSNRVCSTRLVRRFECNRCPRPAHAGARAFPTASGMDACRSGWRWLSLCSVLAIIRHTLGGESVHVDLADSGAAVT